MHIDDIHGLGQEIHRATTRAKAEIAAAATAAATPAPAEAAETKKDTGIHP
jgi:hypothetical protein